MVKGKALRLRSEELPEVGELAIFCLDRFYSDALLSLSDRLQWDATWGEGEALSSGQKRAIADGIAELHLGIDVKRLEEIISELEEMTVNINVSGGCGCGCGCGQSGGQNPTTDLPPVDEQQPPLTPPPATEPEEPAYVTERVQYLCGISNYLFDAIKDVVARNIELTQSGQASFERVKDVFGLFTASGGAFVLITWYVYQFIAGWIANRMIGSSISNIVSAMELKREEFICLMVNGDGIQNRKERYAQWVASLTSLSTVERYYLALLNQTINWDGYFGESWDVADIPTGYNSFDCSSCLGDGEFVYAYYRDFGTLKDGTFPEWEPDGTGRVNITREDMVNFAPNPSFVACALQGRNPETDFITGKIRDIAVAVHRWNNSGADAVFPRSLQLQIYASGPTVVETVELFSFEESLTLPSTTGGTPVDDDTDYVVFTARATAPLVPWDVQIRCSGGDGNVQIQVGWIGWDYYPES